MDSSPSNNINNQDQSPSNSHDEDSSTVVNEQEATSVLNSADSITDVENPLSESNNNHSANSIQENDDDDDEIQELVIRTNSNINNNEPTIQFPNWTLNETEIQTRRETIRIEIERMQRSNFIHFVILCLVPTSLLLIVIAAILSEDGECEVEGGLTSCEREERTFVNAFTTRCICEAVGSVLVKADVGGDVGGEDP